ncbi:MAG: dephospho-CoA kinase [Planctomycetaceae bacterium]|nr:dephospho-CoA kinase [Planctomycetaceae bacterium]
MRIIGILGGVASGKSAVAQQFARLGAGVLDADRAGHEALRMPHVEAAARQRWGAEAFGADGRIDRGRLGRIVFGQEAEEERRYLEQLTHPEITRLLREQAEQMAAAGTSVAILDAPLLLEAGWGDLCEKTVFVDSPAGVRLERALARGWTKEEFAAREAAQESLQRKRQRADAIIDNSGSLQRTQAQIEQFWASLIR